MFSALQTSNTLSATLYCLSTNPAAQEKLRSEVEKVVGSDELVTPQHIARMPYLHDCIRETQRYTNYDLANLWHYNVQSFMIP